MLDEAAYRLLLRQSSSVPPHTYRAVAPDLFESIASQRLPPGQGPPVTPASAHLSSAKEG